jgi:hypothetical protein
MPATFDLHHQQLLLIGGGGVEPPAAEPQLHAPAVGARALDPIDLER